MKKRKPGSFSGFGIGLIVFLAVAMIVRFYIKFEGEAFYVRLFEGAWRFFAAILGSGAIYIVFFLIFYGAASLSDMVFNQSEGEYSKDELLDHFGALSNPLSIICFLAAYILLFLEM